MLRTQLLEQTLNGASQTEDLVGPAGGASVVSTLFYRTLTKVTGNGAASVDISMGSVAVFYSTCFLLVELE